MSIFLLFLLINFYYIGPVQSETQLHSMTQECVKICRKRKGKKMMINNIHKAKSLKKEKHNQWNLVQYILQSKKDKISIIQNNAFRYYQMVNRIEKKMRTNMFVLQQLVFLYENFIYKWWICNQYFLCCFSLYTAFAIVYVNTNTILTSWYAYLSCVTLSCAFHQLIFWVNLL